MQTATCGVPRTPALPPCTPAGPPAPLPAAPQLPGGSALLADAVRPSSPGTQRPQNPSPPGSVSPALPQASTTDQLAVSQPPVRSPASSLSHHHPAVPAPGLGEPGTPTCTSQSVLGPPWPTSLHFTRLSASRPAPTSLQPQTEGRTPTPPRAPGGSEPGDRGGRTPTRRRCRRRLRGLRFRPNLIPARAPPPSTESRRGVQMDRVHVSPRGLPYSLDVVMCLIFMPSRGGGVGGGWGSSLLPSRRPPPQPPTLRLPSSLSPGRGLGRDGAASCTKAQCTPEPETGFF